MSWKTYSLGDLGDFKNGLNYTQENEGLGLKVLSVKDFKDFRTPDIESLGEINPQGIKIEPFLLKQGDIIFVRSNGNKNLIGRSVFIETDIPNLSYSGFCIRMRPNIDNAIPKFLAYYFRSPIFRKQLSNLGGGTNINNLNQKVMKSFQISIPSISTQERIVTLISQYDDLIENNKRRIALLEESVRQLYKEWFTRFRFPGHEHVKIVDGVPDGWINGCVADLGEVVTGKTPSTKIDENYGGDIPFIKTPDMHGQCIVLTTEQCLTERGANTQPKKLIPPNSILVSCIGTIGVTAINRYPAHTNQQINAVIPKKPHLTYFSYFVLSGLKARMEAMGGGATMANVNKAKFASLPILLPSKSLLNSFHGAVSTSFEQVSVLLSTNEKLIKARDLLLPKLMNGELAV